MIILREARIRLTSSQFVSLFLKIKQESRAFIILRGLTKGMRELTYI